MERFLAMRRGEMCRCAGRSQPHWSRPNARRLRSQRLGYQRCHHSGDYAIADFINAAAHAIKHVPKPKSDNSLIQSLVWNDDLIANAPDYTEFLVPDPTHRRRTIHVGGWAANR